MRLLVLTQKIDKEDPVLGFFHDWVLGLAPNFEKIYVVCLGKGEFDLPPNVEVYSLGKEKMGESRIMNYELRRKLRYVFQFFNLLIFKSLEYDTVFVHMNQEYVLLGGLFWKMSGKKIHLWRNHPKGNLLTDVAVRLSDKIFYTSRGSYTARFKKAIQMPVGIDTWKFRVLSLESRVSNSILSLGRISPVKNVHLMVEAAEILKKRGVEFSFDIVGDPVNHEDFEYKRKLEKSGAVNFLPAVPNHNTPELYQNREIFVNLTPSGSFDKTILEAASCGCLPIVANVSLDGVFNELKTELGADNVALKIEEILGKSKGWKENKESELRKYVIENHSLESLIKKISEQLK